MTPRKRSQTRIISQPMRPSAPGPFGDHVLEQMAGEIAGEPDLRGCLEGARYSALGSRFMLERLRMQLARANDLATAQGISPEACAELAKLTLSIRPLGAAIDQTKQFLEDWAEGPVGLAAAELKWRQP